MPRFFLISALLIVCLNSTAQTTPQPFDGKAWVAPYTLPAPKGWDIERFLIPANFAPTILYKGVEDIRFTPGWADAKSDEYWSYLFVWYLDKMPKTNAKILRKNLEAYYTGLVASNSKGRKIEKEKMLGVKASIKKTSTAAGDLKTFRGNIFMVDYMQQKPITLNCIVHLRSCPATGKAFIFYELSPKAFTEAVWQSLHKVLDGFSCINKENK